MEKKEQALQEAAAADITAVKQASEAAAELAAELAVADYLAMKQASEAAAEVGRCRLKPVFARTG